MRFEEFEETHNLKFEILVHALADNHAKQAECREDIAKLQKQEEAILEQLKALGRDSKGNDMDYYFHVIKMVKG